MQIGAATNTPSAPWTSVCALERDEGKQCCLSDKCPILARSLPDPRQISHAGQQSDDRPAAAGAMPPAVQC
jgi:hypothetical protein